MSDSTNNNKDSVEMVTGKNRDELLRTAEDAMRQRNFVEALRCWSTMREMYADVPHAFYRAAWAYIELGSWNEADELCLLAIENFPDVQDSYIVFAESAMRQRDFDMALNRWSDVREKFPHCPHGYFRAAQAYSDKGNWQDAEALCSQGMEKFPKVRDTYIVYAEIAMRQNNFPLALERWEGLRDALPDCPHGYFCAALAYLEMGKYHEADFFCKEGMKIAPTHETSNIIYAEVAVRQCNFELALVRWGLLRERFPNVPHGYFRAAQAYMDCGKFDKAEEFCLLTQKLFPNRYEGYALYADLALRQRDVSLCLKRYERIRKLFPTMVMGYIRPIHLLVSQKNIDEANELVSEANALFSDSQELNIAKIEILISLGKVKEALVQYNVLINKNDNVFIYYLNLAKLYIRLQDYDNASETLNKYFSTNPYPKLYAKRESDMLRIDIIGAKNNDPLVVLKWIIELFSNDSFYTNNKIVQSKFCYYIRNLAVNINFISDVYNNDVLHEAIKYMFTLKEFIDQGWIFLFIRDCASVDFKVSQTMEIINLAINKHDIQTDLANLFNMNINCINKRELIEKTITSGRAYAYKFQYIFPEIKDIYIDVLKSLLIPNKGLTNNESMFFLLHMAYVFSLPEFKNTLNELGTGEHSSLYDMRGLCALIKNNIDNIQHHHRIKYVPSKQKLDIAICVSGQLRGYNKCVDSILNSFNFYEHNYTFFVHTWFNIGRKFPVIVHANRVFGGKFLNTYRNIFNHLSVVEVLTQHYPNFLAILNGEDIVALEDLMDTYKTKNIIIENDNLYPYVTMSNSEKMQYKKYSCVEMTRKFNFDLIVHTRPDIEITKKSTMSLEEIYRHPRLSESIFINGGYAQSLSTRSGVIVDESIQIGTQTIMNAYASTYISYKNIYWYHNALCAPYPFVGHSTNQYHMFCNGIHVEDIPGIKYIFKDPDKIPIEAIYEALKKDVATRTPTENDKLLLQACEEDMRR